MTHPDDDDRELAALFEHARAETRAPSGFAPRVMAQVALAPRGVPALAPAPESAAAFWLRTAARPSVVLAFAMAGLVVGWPQLLAVGGRALARSLTGGVTGAWSTCERLALVAVPALRQPLVAGVLLVVLTVPLLLLARDAARVAERWTVRVAGPAFAPRPGSAG